MMLAVAVLFLTVASAEAGPWWMRWGRGMPQGYDPKTVITLEATVQTVRPAPPMPTLDVATGLGEVVTVVLCPPWYLEQSGIRFTPGDRVLVEGSRVMEDSGRLVVVAARVQKVDEGVTLRLRDEHGRPLWGHMGGPMGSSGRGPMR